MAKQTFVIHINPDAPLKDDVRDFFRVSVKRKETALKYLKGWVQQAKDGGWENIYKGFFIPGACYEVRATPDGYHETETVAKGLVADL